MKIRAKTVNILEENIGVNLHDLVLSNGFLDTTPKAQTAKENIDKINWTSSKLKVSVLQRTSMIKQGKRQPTKREKIFSNHISGMGRVSIMYKKQLQLNNKKDK